MYDEQRIDTIQLSTKHYTVSLFTNIRISSSVAVYFSSHHLWHHMKGDALFHQNFVITRLATCTVLSQICLNKIVGHV